MTRDIGDTILKGQRLVGSPYGLEFDMRSKMLPLIGWMFFLASSIGFTISSYQSGDLAALAGSVLFLVGCLLFLVPTRAAAAND